MVETRVWIGVVLCFLSSRRRHTRCYRDWSSDVCSSDLARAIQGRIQMRKVRFPRFAPWWQNAKAQMLRFPNGSKDDFVDFIAHIGMGLAKQVGARRSVMKTPELHQP